MKSNKNDAASQENTLSQAKRIRKQGGVRKSVHIADSPFVFPDTSCLGTGIIQGIAYLIRVEGLSGSKGGAFRA